MDHASADSLWLDAEGLVRDRLVDEIADKLDYRTFARIKWIARKGQLADE